MPYGPILFSDPARKFPRTAKVRPSASLSTPPWWRVELQPQRRRLGDFRKTVTNILGFKRGRPTTNQINVKEYTTHMVMIYGWWIQRIRKFGEIGHRSVGGCTLRRLLLGFDPHSGILLSRWCLKIFPSDPGKHRELKIQLCFPLAMWD